MLKEIRKKYLLTSEFRHALDHVFFLLDLILLNSSLYLPQSDPSHSRGASIKRLAREGGQTLESAAANIDPLSELCFKNGRIEKRHQLRGDLQARQDSGDAARGGEEPSYC